MWRDGGVALLVSFVSVAGTNALFHAVVGRRLGPADFGALSALLALVLALTLPTTVTQLVITRAVAAAARVGRSPSPALLFRRTALASTVGAVALAAVLTPFASTLRLSSPVPLWCALSFIVPAFTGMVARGVLLGQGRLRIVGTAVVCSALLRLVAAAIFVDGRHGLVIALAVTVASEAVLACVLWAACSTKPDDGHRLSLPWRDTITSLLSFGGLWSLPAAGFVTARWVLEPTDGGSYAAAATAAQALLFMPQAISTLAHSRYSAAPADAATRVLRSATISTVAVCAFGGIAMVVAHEVLTRIWFGDAYDVSPVLMAGLVTASSGIALATLFVTFRLDRSRAVQPSGWIGLAVFMLGAALWGRSAEALATAAAAAAVAAVASSGRVAQASRRRSPMGPPEPLGAAPSDQHHVQLSVVVPFYNPGNGLVSTTTSIVRTLEARKLHFEVIAVDDGSTDGSAQALSDAFAGDDRLTVMRLPRNEGKGHALRQGFTISRGELVGFCDGDGDIDPCSWHPLLGAMAMYDPDIVVGSKRHPDSVLEATRLRRLVSAGYQFFVRRLFRLPVTDTQVGIKLFKRRALFDVLPDAVENGFVLDLELVTLARQRRCRIIEAPVVLARTGSSTIRMRHVVRMIQQTVALRRRTRPAPPAPVIPASVVAALDPGSPTLVHS